MDIKTALARLADRLDLSRDEMKSVMRQIMQGQASDAQIGAFLVALRMKSESLDEITGAVEVMRELATGVTIQTPHLVDIVGTGGDGANLFNVSTAASFVVAAAGGHVAKHGNRSISSKSGSADLLEQAGIQLDLPPAAIARCVTEIGVGFMFAPAHHGAMKHAIGPRRELGLRTIFNILGPMTNPAGVRNQLIGVFSGALCTPVAQVLQRLGSQHVLVVHSHDGLDEISLAAPTQVSELVQGEIREYQIQPEDFGLTSNSLSGLAVADAAESLALIQAALSKRRDARAEKAHDLIALNAGAALYAADIASSLKEGVERAMDTIGGGLALEKIQELADFTTCLTHVDAD